MKNRYIDIYHRTLEYIDNHLSEPLTLEQLSLTVFCSKYHLHRIFSAVSGQTINNYIVTQKLDRAAHQLVFRIDRSITDIGLAAGFANGESFSRAFKRVFGQSPRDYRNKPDRKPWLFSKPNQMEYSMTNDKLKDNVEIVMVDEIYLATMTHKGHPSELHNTINKFIAWRKSHGLSSNASRTFNLFRDDPNQVTPEEFTVDLCAQISTHFNEFSEEVTKTVLPKGRYAKLRHIGKESLLQRTIENLYRKWLVESKESPKDFPLIIERITLYPDVEACDNIIDIYLALEN